MRDLLSHAVLFWLACFELVAGLRGWWGLTWLGRGRWRLLLAALPIWSLTRLRRAPGRAALALLITLLPALMLHLLGSNLRHWRLNPKLRLMPGTYSDRRIERLDIPLSIGYVPALHITALAEHNRSAVCLAHGSGCDKSYYNWRLVDALVERGIAVLLIDLDGHGENPRVQRFPDILESVAEPVRWLKQRYQRVGLIGFSLGACLAARAVADGLHIDALALLEGPPRLVFSQREVRKEALLLLRPSVWHAVSDSSVYHIARAWKTAPIRASISTWDLIATLDLPQSLQKIAAPLLLIYAGSDAIVPPSQAEQVRAAMPAHALWRWIPRASHLSLILEPEMIAVLVPWLGELLSDKH